MLFFFGGDAISANIRLETEILNIFVMDLSHHNFCLRFFPELPPPKIIVPTLLELYSIFLAFIYILFGLFFRESDPPKKSKHFGTICFVFFDLGLQKI